MKLTTTPAVLLKRDEAISEIIALRWANGLLAFALEGILRRPKSKAAQVRARRLLDKVNARKVPA